MFKFLIRVIITILLIGTACSSAAAMDYTLGVLYFETSPGNSPGLPQEEKQALAMAMNEMIISDLSQLSILTLVERQKLNDILEEQKLALMGLVDEETAAQAGEILGARFLMSGSLVFYRKPRHIHNPDHGHPDQ